MSLGYKDLFLGYLIWSPRVFEIRARKRMWDVGLVERVCSWIGYRLRVCFRTAFFTRAYERTNERTGFGAEEASPRLHFLIDIHNDIHFSIAFPLKRIFFLGSVSFFAHLSLEEKEKRCEFFFTKRSARARRERERTRKVCDTIALDSSFRVAFRSFSICASFLLRLSFLSQSSFSRVFFTLF